MTRFAPLAFALLLTVSAETMKLSDMEQGAEFTKCIKIEDFHTKHLADDVDVVARDGTSGCCPEAYIPGQKHYNSYLGAQILCGFKDDGTIAMSSSSSNGVKSCTYNKCYVVKMGHKCLDDTLMKINGCCGADNKKTNYHDNCMMYSKSFTATNAASSGAKVEYCLSYHKKYKMEGTSDKADDQADGKLQLDKLYTYTACAGSLGGSSGGDGGSSGGDGGSSASDATNHIVGFGTIAVVAMGAIFIS